MAISSPCFPYKFFLATSLQFVSNLHSGLSVLKLLISFTAEKDRMSATMENYQKIEKIGEGVYSRRDCRHPQPNSRVDVS